MPSSKPFFSTLVRCGTVLSLALLAIAVAARASTLPSPIRLSDGVTSGPHTPAVMALDAQGHFDVAWAQSNGIFFRHSADGGVTFFNTVEVQALPAGQTAENLRLGVDSDGDITLLWGTFMRTGFLANLFVSHSSDGGFTFSAPKSIASLIPNFFPAIVSDVQLLVHPNGDIDIINFGTLNGVDALFSARSVDGGVTFSVPVQISGLLHHFGFGIEAVRGLHDQIYVFWSDHFSLDFCDIFFSRSTDGGLTFSSPLNLTHVGTLPPPSCATAPRAFVDSAGTIDAIWMLNSSLSDFFSRSFDAGATFSTPKNNVTPGLDSSSHADSAPVAADPTDTSEVNISSTLPAFPPFNNQLFIRSSNHGSTFSTPVLLDPGLGSVGTGAMAMDPHGTVSVAWLGANNTDIFFRRSTNDGTAFSNLTNISNINFFSSDNACSQALMDSHGNAYVLWVGGRTNPDVFFSRIPASATLASDFRISVSPTSVTASPGQTLHFLVTAKAVGTHIDKATFSCGTLIPLATCAFNPPSVTASLNGGTSTLTLTIPASAPPGTSLFAVNGVGGSTTDTQTVVLTVK